MPTSTVVLPQAARGARRVPHGGRAHGAARARRLSGRGRARERVGARRMGGARRGLRLARARARRPLHDVRRPAPARGSGGARRGAHGAHPRLARRRGRRRGARGRSARRNVHAQRMARAVRGVRGAARSDAPARTRGARRRGRGRMAPGPRRMGRAAPQRRGPAQSVEPRARVHVGGGAQDVPRPSAHRGRAPGSARALRPVPLAAVPRAGRAPAQRAGPDRRQHGDRGARGLRAALRLAVSHNGARALSRCARRGLERRRAPRRPLGARGISRRRALRVELRRRGAALSALLPDRARVGGSGVGGGPAGLVGARSGRTAPRGAGPRLAHRHARRRESARAPVRTLPGGRRLHAGVEPRLGLPGDRAPRDRHQLPPAPAGVRAALPLVPAALSGRHRGLRSLALRRRDLDEPRGREGRAHAARHVPSELRVHADALHLGAGGRVLPAEPLPVAAFRLRARRVRATARVGRPHRSSAPRDARRFVARRGAHRAPLGPPRGCAVPPRRPGALRHRPRNARLRPAGGGVCAIQARRPRDRGLSPARSPAGRGRQRPGGEAAARDRRRRRRVPRLGLGR